MLKSIIPLPLRKSFQQLYYASPRWISEKSAIFMKSGMLSWLVGSTERFDVEVTKSDGSKEIWQSGVKLTQCRYLMESGCKAACLHLCKAPTQEFFSKELNFPLYMKPNFADCSCEMMFGVNPPAEEDDPAYQENCYNSCNMLQRMSHTEPPIKSPPKELAP